MTSASESSSLPRILFMDHTATLGGGEIALLNLARNIDPARFQITVLLFADGPLAGKLREAGIDVQIEPLDAAVGNVRKGSIGVKNLSTAATLWRSLRFTTVLKKRIRSIGPDLIHTNSLKSHLLGGIAALRAGTPVIWHIRDRIADDYLPGPVAWVFRRLCRWLPTYIVTISQSTLLALRLPAGFTGNGKRARVVYDGVIVDAPRPKVNSSPLLVGIVGRISEWKGQHIFLKAAAKIREKYPDVKYQIIGSAMFGEDAYDKKIQELTDELQLRQAVVFTGFREDVPELMAKLDILIHASTIGEPFGQVVAEGMAAGKPVVATAGGGVPEIIEDGVSGMLVPMGDAEAMAGAVMQLIGNAELRERMGKAARQRAEEYFTIQRTAQGVQAVWDEVLSKGV